MTCKDFSGMIPDFLDDLLDNASLQEFLDHYDSCKNCREELEIQYLVSKAFDRTEVVDEINISRDLPAYIEKEQQKLKSRVRLEKTALIMESAAILLAVITAVIYFV